MPSMDGLTRRHFLAVSGAVAAASGINNPNVADAETAATADTRLAIDGGAKTVQEILPPRIRWGEAEREQLDATLAQDTLFYWQGPQTTLFTERFRQTCPLKYVMTCSSGTAAVHIAVAAAGIGPGDEVITSPITDIGTVIGVIYQQGVPVFADLGANTYNLDPADVERKITPKTKAIIAVQLAGNPCRMAELKAIADKHDLVLIEDCAQAWGAKYRGQPVGTIGHFACFSLQHTKQITAGDGGVVASSDERFGPLLQSYGDKGGDRIKGGGVFERFSTNYRMTELQAAVAAVQLERLEGFAAQRAKLGDMLGAALQGLPGIEPHEIDPQDRSTYWFYMFRMKPEKLRCDRAQLIKALVAEGAPFSAGYIPTPLYGAPIFQKHAFFAGRWPIKEFGLTSMDYSQVSCPNAEQMLATGVRMVIHEGMTENYIASIGDAIRKVANHFAKA